MDKKDKKITIDEQDLFNYVFFPESTPDEIRLVIESGNTWIEIIEFYKNLKSNSNNSADDKLKRKIACKIPAYSLLKCYTTLCLKRTVYTKTKWEQTCCRFERVKTKDDNKNFR